MTASVISESQWELLLKLFIANRKMCHFWKSNYNIHNLNRHDKYFVYKQKVWKGQKVFTESSHQRCSIKKAFLKNFAIFTGKHLCWSLFLMKLQVFRLVTLFKRDSNIGVCEILKNTCFEEHLLTAASGV